MIISVLNIKGGVGKTTIATNLAYTMQKHSLSTVLLVDSDPQGSARDWHMNSDGSILDVIGLDRSTLDKDVVKFRKQYDYIFIDGAPQLSEMALKAILASDMILIPVQPSPYDIWASKDLVDLIKQRQKINANKPHAAFVISRQIVGTNIGKEVRDVLKEYELPVFKCGTFQRIAYPTCAASGRTVYFSSDENAKREILLLSLELKGYINEHIKNKS